MGDLLVTNIGELVTLEGGVRYGHRMSELGIVRHAAVAIVDGAVADVGPSEKVARRWRGEIELRVNAQGRAVVPGLVDPHTHAVFAGDRSHEMELKAKGATYSDILKQGGGIHFTVQRTREASRAELLKGLLSRLDRMLDNGTTTVEVKTGYGLDLETELRLLDTIGDAAERHVSDVVATFLGAHAVPPEHKDPATYAAFVAEKVVPEISQDATFCDVFCDVGAFDVASSRRVLEAARVAGMKLKVHADELARSGGSLLAAELHATSADHLIHANPDDVAALVAAGVVPVLAPGTAFQLGGRYPDARAMIDAGAPVALATDLSPSTWMESMPLAMSLACQTMRLTPAEALSAATINAAAAIDRAEEVGSIEKGKKGDLVLLDAPSHAHLPYRMGANLVWRVVKEGDVVVDRSDRH